MTGWLGIHVCIVQEYQAVGSTCFVAILEYQTQMDHRHGAGGVHLPFLSEDLMRGLSQAMHYIHIKGYAHRGMMLTPLKSEI